MRVGLETAGPVEFWSRVSRGLARRIYLNERFIIVEQRLDGIVDVPVCEGVRIALLGEDRAALDRILTARQRIAFDRRIRAGRECLLAWRGARVIGYTWMSISVDPSIEGTPLALPPGAAYLWDLFVVRAERGAGIGSALTAARLAWARRQGFDLGWRMIVPSNRPSLRTAEKTGTMRVLGEVLVVSRGGDATYRETRFEDRPLLTNLSPGQGVRPGS